MNLLQIRQQFRTLSGRYDLVNEDGSDNGADFFINAGSKFLDRMDETQKSWASCFRFIEKGLYSVSIPHCRAIKEVWVATTSARWQLEKKLLQDLIAEYMSGMPSTRSSGTPLYYSPTITRYIPEEVRSMDFESFIGWVDIPSGNVHEYNTILLNIPTSERLAVEVKGLFYASLLNEDDDENYWSIMHSSILIMSALRQVEIVNRNTQGVNDWTNAITLEMTQLGMDLVDELVAEVDQMEG